jgi:hypothetical protein
MQVARLGEFRDKGLLSDEELEAKKAEIIGGYDPDDVLSRRDVARDEGAAMCAVMCSPSTSAVQE